MKDDHRSVRYEVWIGGRTNNSELHHKHTGWNVRKAIELGDWSSKQINIRHFYDRHLRERVVQLIFGLGWGVR